MLAPAAAGLALLCMYLYFHRDPERAPPDAERVVLAPADGKVVKLRRERQGPLWGGEHHVVSIFMSFRDVHVNRAPISGVVRSVRLFKGGHSPAFTEKSRRNARCLIEIEGEFKCYVELVAGLIARRIRCYVESGDRVEAGSRIGMIKLGSRVNLYLPADLDFNFHIKEGSRVRAGETVVASW